MLYCCVCVVLISDTLHIKNMGKLGDSQPVYWDPATLIKRIILIIIDTFRMFETFEVYYKTPGYAKLCKTVKLLILSCFILSSAINHY